MSIVTAVVTPTLTRADGSALTLAELAHIEGFTVVKGADPSTAVSAGQQAAAASVTFSVPGLAPGDYSFFATATDTQTPPLTSAASALFDFTVPVAPPVVLAAPSAPVVSDVTATP